jgi:antimicrobial peptide system SdpB family protein
VELRAPNMNRIIRLAVRYEPRGLPLAVARTALAIAHLSILAFTPEQSLYFPLQGLSDGARCGGPRMLALWCILGPSPAAREMARVLGILVLLVVASGYRPRWTCIPHYYITYSLSVSMTLPTGGEQVAQILTMLLIPVCFVDMRKWHWKAPVEPLRASWRGASLAALYAVRIQAAIIYGTAAVSKLLVAQWRDGTALYAIAIDPNFGFPLGIDSMKMTPIAILILKVTTWSAVGIELAIAGLVLGSRRMRFSAMVLGIALHGAIIALMGLFSFGVIMIALLAIVNAGRLHPPRSNVELRPTYGRLDREAKTAPR